MHTIKELDEMVAWKIPAYAGRDTLTNLAILELLALEGPKTIWNTNADLGRTRLQYPTIFRAIGRLRKGRYLKKTGSAKMKKVKGRTPKFGVTWRGFLAALVSEKVCANVLDVLRNNPKLDLPIPREIFFDLVGTLWPKEQIEEISWIIFEKIVETLPYDIESTEDKLLVGYFLPALMAALPELEKYPPSRPMELLKYPKVIDFFEKQIDHQIRKFEDTLRTLREGKSWLAGLNLEGSL